ncbi:MAG: DNA mismatch repair endonuclease MutL [Myxococcota bacterium]|nr:DNA mismatch repair endonuclease MutL [Myxococcota bacterium]
MAVIRILEDHLVNQIAAGEVIERPAAVVKELVENALDAGSSNITVKLQSGGRQLISVADDGKGMDASDALMCLERHGTSKIRNKDDLFSVDTLGFRGEAIPSIASVSRFEILTRARGEEQGTRVRVEGGKLQAPEPAGCVEGTQVQVRQLFFNVPVRRKFLRTVPTELGHCTEAVVRQALVHPEVDFTVEHAGTQLVRAPRREEVRLRAADLLGRHGQALVPVDFEGGPLSVRALLSPVGVHQGSARGSMYLYVNGRYVRDGLMRQAVRDAYRHIVPKGRYPLVLLDVRLPPDHVDVNIHPSKVEVRFRHGRELVGALSDGLREGLQQHGIRRPVDPRRGAEVRPDEHDGCSHAEPALPLPQAAPVFSPGWTSPVASPDAAPVVSEQPHSRPVESVASVSEPVGSEAIEENALLPVPRFADLRIIGQFAQTYIICEAAGEMVLIDQHAAHERVTLHRLQQDAAQRLGAPQRLLTPVVIELPLAKAALLEEHLDVLERLQVEVEPYGGGSFAVRGVPPAMGKVDIARLLEDIADELAEGGKATAGQEIADHILATMACHGSVRAHQVLSDYEMRQLLLALDGIDFGVCAHGRPVAIRLSEHELEHRFHRN